VHTCWDFARETWETAGGDIWDRVNTFANQTLGIGSSSFTRLNALISVIQHQEKEKTGCSRPYQFTYKKETCTVLYKNVGDERNAVFIINEGKPLSSDDNHWCNLFFQHEGCHSCTVSVDFYPLDTYPATTHASLAAGVEKNCLTVYRSWDGSHFVPKRVWNNNHWTIFENDLTIHLPSQLGQYSCDHEAKVSWFMHGVQRQ